MLIALAFNHLLDAIGIYAIVTTAVKIARGYPVKRWFY